MILFERRFVDIKQLSRYLSLHPATIREMISSGRIPGQAVVRIVGEKKGKNGGRRDTLRLDLKIIDQWLNEQRESLKCRKKNERETILAFKSFNNWR